MKSPLRLLTLLVAVCAAVFARAETAAPAQVKPGFTVVVEIEYDEQGVPQDGKVVQSDDPTGDHTLEQVALHMGAQDKQPPKLVDGKAMKFKARRPFNFPVEDDQGEAANANKPMLRKGQQVLPVYPPELAAKDVNGGCVVELTILASGEVQSIRTLRASHPEFAQASELALKQWVFNPQEGPGTPASSVWRVAVGFSTNGKLVDLKWRLAPRPSIGAIVIGHLQQQAAAPVTPAAPAAPGDAPVTLPAPK